MSQLAAPAVVARGVRTTVPNLSEEPGIGEALEIALKSAARDG